MTAMIVIPAAGSSRRMGGEDKLIRIVDGVPLIRRTALQAIASGNDVLVTLRPDDDERRAALAGLGLRILSITDANTGMSASLRRAAQEAGSSPALMILPADMPEISAHDLSELWATHTAHPKQIVQGMAGLVPGHPVIIPQDIVPELQKLTGDTGARPILERHCQRILPVPLYGRRAILDLDTPKDWAAWTASRKTSDLMENGQLDPPAAALSNPADFILAVITGVHGTSWRRPGAIMCLWRDGTMVGQLTGGCIEADLSLRVGDVLDTARPATVRYGMGSPYFDIRLPCGGGLDITLIPVRDRRALLDLVTLRQSRVRAGLRFRPNGQIDLDMSAGTGWHGPDFVVSYKPKIRFLVFGQGEDARIFTAIARAAGYGVIDEDLVEREAGVNFDGRLLRPVADDMLLLADDRTGVLTFFHDLEKDVAIIAAALRGSACYVGALGSSTVATKRLSLLREAGISPERLSKLHAPVGLISSTRDPRGLAVSILAEIIAHDLKHQVSSHSAQLKVSAGHSNNRK